MTGRPNELTAVEAARRIDAGELTVEALVTGVSRADRGA